MKRTLVAKISIAVVAIALIGVALFLILRPKDELRTVGSEAELYSFYEHDKNSFDFENPIFKLLLMPFSVGGLLEPNYYYYTGSYYEDSVPPGAKTIDAATNSNEGFSFDMSSTKDYSTTNIQVENVDEADIIKTDGDYMYSISGDEVVVTDVRDTNNPKVASRIKFGIASPEDLVLSGDTLTIIGTEATGAVLTSGRYSNADTSVYIYNIADRNNPYLTKSYKLNLPYYTSRRIDDRLYVIASGRLRKKSNESLVDRSYIEDNNEKEFPVNSIRYLEDVLTDNLTLFSVVDLGNLDNDIAIEPFLIDISNAYVSENAFYLLDEGYAGGEQMNVWERIKPMFGYKGIFGFFDENSSFYPSFGDYQTKIYKFNINDSGDVSYVARTEIDGTTINQYSLDEHNGHLRIALEDDDGSGAYVAIFDENLGKIGESRRVGKNEQMYASRFVGDKAYLVTYRNTDPLFVIDLSNETEPKVLGELKIPGYSVYLHPYDENHLIGIGIDTVEETSRDLNGKIITTSVYVNGMKLALFDVSDFENPKEISKTHIGDSRTTSAILTNPKALLFSKEKHLLGIPVNNYNSEFKIAVGSTSRTPGLESVFYDREDDRVSEGYLIYNVDLDSGITKRGEVIHENSKLIRGAYIEDDLITVSENKLMINGLSDLGIKAELNLTKEE